jgi:hypothetical protein
MKSKKQLSVKYSYVDCEQSERQKRLEDAYDVIFDEIDIEDLECINNKNEYEQPAIIKR